MNNEQGKISESKSLWVFRLRDSQTLFSVPRSLFSFHIVLVAEGSRPTSVVFCLFTYSGADEASGLLVSDPSEVEGS